MLVSARPYENPSFQSPSPQPPKYWRIPDRKGQGHSEYPRRLLEKDCRRHRAQPCSAARTLPGRFQLSVPNPAMGPCPAQPRTHRAPMAASGRASGNASYRRHTAATRVPAAPATTQPRPSPPRSPTPPLPPGGRSPPGTRSGIAIGPPAPGRFRRGGGRCEPGWRRHRRACRSPSDGRAGSARRSGRRCSRRRCNPPHGRGKTRRRAGRAASRRTTRRSGSTPPPSPARGGRRSAATRWTPRAAAGRVSVGRRRPDGWAPAP